MSPTVFERTEEIRQEFLAAAADLAVQIEALATQRQHALRMAHVLAQEANEARRLLEPPPAADALRAGGMPPVHLSEPEPPSPIAVWIRGAVGLGGWACKVCKRPIGDDGFCGEHSHISDHALDDAEPDPTQTITDPPGRSPFRDPDPAGMGAPQGDGPPHQATPDAVRALTDLDTRDGQR